MPLNSVNEPIRNLRTGERTPSDATPTTPKTNPTTELVLGVKNTTPKANEPTELPTASLEEGARLTLIVGEKIIYTKVLRIRDRSHPTEDQIYA